MKTSTKAILVATLVGLVGIGGLAKAARAIPMQATKPAAIEVAEREMSETRETGESRDDLIDANQSAKLRALAKITPQQAQQAAEATVAGKATSVKLENEDGSLVYSVAIAQQEVKVDAGNGRVLYTDSLNNEGSESNHIRSSIQVSETGMGDGDGETNDDMAK
ncbi:PepSY domain-containing protein [Phormidium tenue]|uniref:PepSY domain-containing protein n=1 Tax=Phormidium tenue FACHB-1050 TaxID=2692857 RepID=A0ABR8C899_9CYAN|nr:PepSY domain-containing protein [Phormidium tenue]MBD2316385.1 PepSY domain-containing protein [Phormidium tenue FACHB-1050]